MQIVRGLADFPGSEPLALAMGAFDGVHRGHQALLRSALATGQPAWALTFDPLPRQVLGHPTEGLLTTLEERLELLADLGLTGTIILPFNREVAQQEPEDFLAQLLQVLRLHSLWVGHDFALGRARRGDVAFLQQHALRHGYQLHTLAPVLWEGQPVHSSRIRRALLAGDLREANGCLGYPYRLRGPVGHGDGRGRQLGFPTANVQVPAERLLPAYGVYLGLAHTPLGAFPTLINLGVRPTYPAAAPLVEAYLLDFSADLYGTTVTLDLWQRLRPELRFSSAQELCAQMERDLAQARELLKHTPGF